MYTYWYYSYSTRTSCTYTCTQYQVLHTHSARARTRLSLPQSLQVAACHARCGLHGEMKVKSHDVTLFSSSTARAGDCARSQKCPRCHDGLVSVRHRRLGPPMSACCAEGGHCRQRWRWCWHCYFLQPRLPWRRWSAPRVVRRAAGATPRLQGAKTTRLRACTPPSLAANPT